MDAVNIWTEPRAQSGSNTHSTILPFRINKRIWIVSERKKRKRKTALKMSMHFRFAASIRVILWTQVSLCVSRHVKSITLMLLLPNAISNWYCQLLLLLCCRLLCVRPNLTYTWSVSRLIESLLMLMHNHSIFVVVAVVVVSFRWIDCDTAAFHSH